VVIDGVGWRYLLVPALMISYAVSRMEKTSGVAQTQAVAWISLGMFGIISVVMTVDLLKWSLLSMISVAKVLKKLAVRLH
jgi:hypothetical protein